MKRARAWAKDIAIGAIALFILTNIISYLRQPELPSDHLPKIEAILLDGTSYLSTQSKPLVIHFWATWCPACKLEAANIQRVSKHYEVLTIAVNSGEDSKIQDYMDERELSYKVINDQDGNWAQRFRVEAFPTTFIYDAKGQLRFTEVGYTTTAGLLARLKLIE